jgi:broad specificity phosphatase PhoE
MNAAGRLQGKGINAPLNEEGQQQANGLGHFLSNTTLHIVCSSLDRYKQPCASSADLVRLVSACKSRNLDVLHSEFEFSCDN